MQPKCDNCGARSDNLTMTKDIKFLCKDCLKKSEGEK